MYTLSPLFEMGRHAATHVCRDMNSVFIAVTRREYIHVGSAPASLLETVTSTNTEFMPLQHLWDSSGSVNYFLSMVYNDQRFPE